MCFLGVINCLELHCTFLNVVYIIKCLFNHALPFSKSRLDLIFNGLPRAT